LWGCSGVTRDAGELFKLQAECADQARQFKTEWLKFIGPDYRHSLVRNHYNAKDGRCYVDVYTNLDSDPMSHFEVVHDATQGFDAPPLAMRQVRGANTTWPDIKADGDADAKKIQALMEDTK
jgi:hypothetical protein